MCVCVCVCVAKPVAVELRCHATALITTMGSNPCHSSSHGTKVSSERPEERGIAQYCSLSMQTTMPTPTVPCNDCACTYYRF